MLESARVAVWLISPDSLASDFCVEEEVPYLIERGERHGLLLIPVMLRPCIGSAFPWLSRTQTLSRVGRG